MAKTYKKVVLGKNSKIDEDVILGYPPRGKNDGDLATSIGDNAVIRSQTIIYSGNIIGNNFQTGPGVKIREENKIGDGVSVGTLSVVEHHVVIEDNVRIHTQAFIPEYTILKKGCWIGPNVCITNALYPNSPTTKDNLVGVTIEEGAVVGANATILPGITIGKNALVGAGSVVTKNVAADTVVAGNPARFIKNKSDLHYDDGKKPYS